MTISIYQTTDFREFPSDISSYQLYSRIQSPALKIIRENRSFKAILGAIVKKNGNNTFLPCPSIFHNWLLDETFIKPLPHDIQNYLPPLLWTVDPDQLSFSNILALSKIKQDYFSLIIDHSVMESANKRSTSLSLDAPIPNLRANLFDYQNHGIAWLNEAIDSIGGAILADEMGLGKTLQIISLILLKDPLHTSSTLVVCPTSLITNWKNEIHKFAPTLTVQIHRGNNRSGYFRDLLKSNIVITTYETLTNDITMFRGLSWDFVIFDEAQALKNPNSRRRIAASKLKSKYCIPVTGTPVENSLVDLWSLADLSVRGILGNLKEFEQNFSDTFEAADELNSITAPLVLKRRVCDVADDLPARRDIDLPIEMSERELDLYEKTRFTVMKEYGQVGRLVAVGQLAIFCAHPWLRSKSCSPSEWPEDTEIVKENGQGLMTPKLELCCQLIKESAYFGNKILVFAAYNNCEEIIRTALKQVNVKLDYWNSINGSTPQESRQQIIDEFTNTHGSAVLVLNPKAAGAGLNITAATVVIHYTQNWNPALEMQASARAHRRGQTKPVTIYRLFYKNTVEETMMERSLWKRQLGGKAIPIASRETSDLSQALSLSPKWSQNG